MNVRDLMTTDPITTTPETSLKEAARVMVRERISGLPVVDGDRLVGIVTEGDFLRQEAHRGKAQRLSILDVVFGDSRPEPPVDTVGQVMSDSVITIDAGATLSEAARVMAKRGVKRLPVVDGEGALIGVISRADVVNAFTKPDDVIEDEVREDILRRLLFLEPDAVSVEVSEGVVTLSGELENRTEAHLLEELTRRISGVIRVESNVTYQVDDERIGKTYPLS